MERANRRESPRIAANRHRKPERIASESPLKHTRQSLPEWSLERGVGRSDDAIQGEGPCAKAWFSVGPIKSWVPGICGNMGSSQFILNFEPV